METISKLRRRFLILVAISFALSGASFILLRSWGINLLQIDLQTLARGYSRALQMKLDSDLDVLQAAARYLEGPGEISRSQLKTADAILMARHPEIESVLWLPGPGQTGSITVPPGTAIPVRRQTAQKKAAPGVAPATPLDALLNGDGTDLLHRAWRTGKAQAAPPDLALPPGQRANYHIFVPVYRAPATTTWHEPQSVKGFLVATIGLRKLADGALQRLEHADMDVSLYDGAGVTDEGLLFRYRMWAPREADKPPFWAPFELPLKLEVVAPIDAVGRRWQLVCHPASSDFATSRMWTGRMVLAASFLCSLLLAINLFIALNRAVRFEQLVAQRTRELQQQVHEREQAESRLRDSAAKLEQSNRELERLNELSELLQTCHTLDEAANVIALMAGELFQETRGAVAFSDRTTGLLTPITTWGELDFAALKSDGCLAIRTRRPHLYSAEAGSMHCPHVTASPDAESYLCIPLLAQERILGLLHVAGLPWKTLQEGQQRFAQTVAEQLSPALGKLVLQEELRELSIRDPLTNLFNRRYLEETLARETSRAQRTERPLGIIMLDIDHFKHFNDRYGHAVGDALLENVGTILSANVRREDVACRYGGEEFTLILPEATLEQAVARAELLRVAITEMQLEEAPRETVTISLGVAAMPEHGETADALLRAADVALYQAKTNGRNRVEIAGKNSRHSLEEPVAPATPVVVDIPGSQPKSSFERPSI